MKKNILLGFIAILLVGLLAACGQSTETTKDKSSTADSEPKTRIYKGENGDVEIPANPKRIAMLGATYAGNLLELGITPIAVNEWPKGNKFYEGKLDDVEVVTEDSLEKLISLNPDLIVTYSTDKNIKKYEEIAPTIALTYEKYNYLDQHIEIGKIVGKEEEAKQWVEEWKEKSDAASKKVKEAIGEDKTFMVFESFGKDLYVYGNNWGRGTEVIYQALGLKAPEKLEQDVFATGWKAISAEVIPQYAGDYIFVGDGGGNAANNSFMETDVWKGIPAVQKNQVIQFDSASFYFNDPISLEKELDFIVENLTKGK
ncbi:iron-hydroxamate ABC transporter substrate-binding protein [Peribacillus alkalitolerans]|uniref:iron-hydroxamate ABC transporter substrate-binding protein n=1 Tax=Peribacillus alkalitolerans TaxID=1550385 RepID=UPI0013D818E2|nr:iron-hydroxamate ABC transporter substrate-binding protein [Peribacillus alkalitolerans]